MITYFSNVLQDIFYGYIEIKCVNESCKRVFKISRNKINLYGTNNYSCNMGCALSYFNQYNSNKKDDEKEVPDQNSK